MAEKQVRLPRNAIVGQAVNLEPDHAAREKFVYECWRTGNKSKAGKLAGIAPGTIVKWSASDWFKKRTDEIRREANRQLDRKLTLLVDKGLEALEDRLDKGDSRLVFPKVAKGEDPLPPTLVRVPLTAQTLTIMTGVLLDKRTVIRKDQEEGVTPNESFDRMVAKLREFARPKSTDAIDVESRDVTPARDPVDSTPDDDDTTDIE